MQWNSNKRLNIYKSIYNDINTIKFEGKLPDVIIAFTERDVRRYGYLEIVDSDISEVCIRLSKGKCLSDFVYATLGMFNCMICMYCIMNEIKYSSNGQTYFNKKFRDVAVKHGGVVKRISECDYNTGYSLVDFDDSIHKLIFNYSREYEKEQTVCEKHKVQHSNTMKQSNSLNPKSHHRKYIDYRSGESVRATKDHILFCLDDMPDIALKIEKQFGIRRMILENKECDMSIADCKYTNSGDDMCVSDLFQILTGRNLE